MLPRTTTKLHPAFATAIAKIQPSLEAWRKLRKPREPIPEPFWQAMIRLAQTHRPSPVAQALRVNYSALKRRVLADRRSTPAELSQTSPLPLPANTAQEGSQRDIAFELRHGNPGK